MQEREILFRGKRVDNGEWVYGFYYKAKFYATDKELCDYITVPYPEEEGRRSDHFMISPETRGEYTGSTDKNGVKIFEGDIVECVLNIEDWEHNPETGKVVITEPVDEVVYKDNGFELKESPLSLWLYDGSDTCDYIVEVLGNIHDNPELLEVK